MSELKPCPFCGRKQPKDAIYQTGGVWSLDTRHNKTCVLYESDIHNGCFEKRKPTLVKKWNTRHTEKGAESE